jgi:hypothetical protein
MSLMKLAATAPAVILDKLTDSKPLVDNPLQRIHRVDRMEMTGMMMMLAPYFTELQPKSFTLSLANRQSFR